MKKNIKIIMMLLLFSMSFNIPNLSKEVFNTEPIIVLAEDKEKEDEKDTDSDDKEKEDADKEKDEKDKKKNDKFEVDDIIDEFNGYKDQAGQNIKEEDLTPVFEDDEQAGIDDWKTDYEIANRDRSTTLARTIFMIVGYLLVGLGILTLLVSALLANITIKPIKIMGKEEQGTAKYITGDKKLLEENTLDQTTYFGPKYLQIMAVFFIVIAFLLLTGLFYRLVQVIILLAMKFINFLTGN